MSKSVTISRQVVLVPTHWAARLDARSGWHWGRTEGLAGRPPFFFSWPGAPRLASSSRPHQGKSGPARRDGCRKAAPRSGREHSLAAATWPEGVAPCQPRTSPRAPSPSPPTTTLQPTRNPSLPFVWHFALAAAISLPARALIYLAVAQPACFPAAPLSPPSSSAAASSAR